MLTKGQGKGTWALSKKLAKALDDYLAKEGCLEDVFQTNPQELSTLCIYPKQLLNNQRMCQSTKHCLSQLLPNIFILLLMRNIPLITMTSIVFCFGNCVMNGHLGMTRNASTLTQDLGWDDIEGHLLDQLLKPTHAIE